MNNSNRAEYLWRFYVSDPYESLVCGLRNFRENIHLVEYNNLTQNPEQELQKIYEFLEIEPHQHNFSNIVNTCGEQKDNEWGLEKLHDIRPELKRISKSPEEVIGEENVNFMNFLI